MSSIYIPGIPYSDLYTQNIPELTTGVTYPQGFSVRRGNNVYVVATTFTYSGDFVADAEKLLTEFTNSASVRLCEVGAAPGDNISTNGAWQEAIDRLSGVPASTLKWIVVDDYYTTNAPLIYPRGYAVSFFPGGKLTAVTPWSGVTSNGKNVNSVLSGPTDSATGYWELGKILNPEIDAAGIADYCIELWRHRFCTITNAELQSGRVGGFYSHQVPESTSYELTINTARCYYNQNTQSSAVTSLSPGSTYGFRLENTTDVEISHAKSINYNIGFYEDANCGANVYTVAHVWSRPPHSVSRAFWFVSNAGKLYGGYADTPICRDITSPDNLAPAATTSYGLYLDGGSWQIDSFLVDTNPGNDGVGRPYYQDLQGTGIFFGASSAGNRITNAIIKGRTSTKRLGNGIAGTIAASTALIFPQYSNVAANARISRLPRGIQFMSTGAPSVSWFVNDYEITTGAGFGNAQADFSVYPQSNGTSGIRDARIDFFLSTGTTGTVGAYIFNGTADGGTTPSDQVSHQFLVRGGISAIAHSKTAESPIVIVGLQNAVREIQASDRSARAITGTACFDFKRPVNFESTFYLPQYTTVQRDALGVLAQAGTLIRNSTSGNVEFSPDGTDWNALRHNRLITQTAHGFTVGQAVRISAANTHATAQANSQANLTGVVGIVSEVPSVNTFRIAYPGDEVIAGTTTPGATYFISAATTGALTATAPGTPNFVMPIAVGNAAGNGYRVGIFSFFAGV